MFFELPLLNLKNENVKIGDVYKFYFDVKYKALRIEKTVLTWIVDRTDTFEVENSEYDPDTGELVLTCVVVKNPLPFLVVFGILLAGSTGFLAMLGITLNRVHKVIDAPTGKILTYSVAALTVFIIGKNLITAIK